MNEQTLRLLYLARVSAVFTLVVLLLIRDDRDRVAVRRRPSEYVEFWREEGAA